MEVSGQLHAPAALLPGKEPHNLLIVNKSFQSVAKFKYLETTVKIKILFTKKLSAD
jgi:hypothetical protein